MVFDECEGAEFECPGEFLGPSFLFLKTKIEH